MPADELSAALFGGECVEFRDLDSVASLGARARDIVENLFGVCDPERLAGRVDAALHLEIAAAARKAVAGDATLARLWRATLSAIGLEANDCYVDRIRLRIVPSRSMSSGHAIRPLPAHRDTWASGIQAQVNWWMPLYPLSPSRTMFLWPQLFHHHVPNDSAEWDHATLLRSKPDDYPLLPVATVMPDSAGAAVLIEPGTLLAFSGAHLHASVADDSGISRISLDTRTVWAADVRAGRGAANIDGQPERAHWEWFRNPGDPDSSALAGLAAAGERTA